MGLGLLLMALLAVNVSAFTVARDWPWWVIPAALGASAGGYFGAGGLWLRRRYRERHRRYFGRD